MGKSANNLSTEIGKKRPLWRVLIVVAILILLISVAIFLFIWSKRVFFTENPRFTLRHVELSSSGYWNKRSDELSRELGLKAGEQNLFALSLGTLREKALKLASVERCEVSRVLPDTLQFRIIERIPRAQLSRYPGFVVDGEGVLLPRNKCMQFSTNLPLLYGLPQQMLLRSGEVLQEAKPALTLMMMALRSFSDIDIRAVNVDKPDTLTLYVSYANRPARRVIMPSSIKGMELRLKALRTAIIQGARQNDGNRTLNLSFDGRVIVQ